eukprot:TRINITY_DN4910_c0_g1_i1.p1 TRINITY_DN4910_c0_g1~~TRINITY_DN4910_c0_g1_i1.p1  ORF type:complete len:1105 (-),score=261.94 TRINITY_DN4910_c0_g1_i1:28-3117(-)
MQVYRRTADQAAISLPPYEETKFVPNMRAETKKVFEDILLLLRDNPTLLVAILEEAGFLNTDENRTWKDRIFREQTHTLCHAIIFTLYSNCFTQYDEKLLLHFIRQVWDFQLRRAVDALQFLKQESFATDLLANYLRYTYATPYLAVVLSDIVITVCQDQHINLESDPAKKQIIELECSAEFKPQPGESCTATAPAAVAVTGNHKLETLAKQVVTAVLDRPELLPFGLRWMAASVCKIAAEIHPDMSTSLMQAYLAGVIFNNFIVPAIIRPEDWMPSTHVSHLARNNLVKIAKLVFEFVVDPLNHPAMKDEKDDDLTCRIMNWFQAIVAMEEPHEFFCDDADQGLFPLTTTSDMYCLLTICATHFPKKLASINTTLEPPMLGAAGKLDKLLALASNQLSVLSQGSPPKLVLFRDLSTVPSTPKKHAAGFVPGSVGKCKQHLVMFLRVVDNFCGAKQKSVVDTLTRQLARNRFFQTNVLVAQTQTVLRCLEGVPLAYKEEDFKLLLDSMFEDYAARKEALLHQLQTPLPYLNKLQLQLSKVRAQQTMLVECLAMPLLKDFFLSTFTKREDEFVTDFARRFTRSSPCRCKPVVFTDENVICTTCAEKSAVFARFMTVFRDKFADYDSATHNNFGNSDGSLAALASHSVESRLLVHLFPLAFPVLSADDEFFKQAHAKCHRISMTALLIQQRYHCQAPWIPAQEEIRKLDIYKAPYDKFICFMNAWKIITNNLRPFGEYTSDDFLPIMAYVLLQVQVPDLLANIQFIGLYSTLDDSEEMWLTHVKSAVEILWEAFNGKMPMWKNSQPLSGGKQGHSRKHQFLQRTRGYSFSDVDLPRPRSVSAPAFASSSADLPDADADAYADLAAVADGGGDAGAGSAAAAPPPNDGACVIDLGAALSAALKLEVATVLSEEAAAPTAAIAISSTSAAQDRAFQSAAEMVSARFAHPPNHAPARPPTQQPKPKHAPQSAVSTLNLTQLAAGECAACVAEPPRGRSPSAPHGRKPSRAVSALLMHGAKPCVCGPPQRSVSNK